jgi:RNA polymerase sigma factor (sigma-70 family)
LADRLEALIARYGRLIRSVVARVARRTDDDLGDEIEQRVAEALWGQLRREQTIEHPASYIYRCAVRETIRELGRIRAHEPIDDAQAGPPAADPEDDARGRQLAAATEAALGELAPERAQAARAHLAGFSVEEIMSTHGWPYQKARNLVARGMADLRRLLAARGFDER